MKRTGFVTGEPSALPQVRENQRVASDKAAFESLVSLRDQRDKLQKRKEFYDKWIGEWKETLATSCVIAGLSYLIFWIAMITLVGIYTPSQYFYNYFKDHGKCYETKFYVGDQEHTKTEEIPCSLYDKRIKYGV